MSIKYRVLLFPILALLLTAVLACSQAAPESADSNDSASTTAANSAFNESAETTPDSIAMPDSPSEPASAPGPSSSGYPGSGEMSRPEPSAMPEAMSEPSSVGLQQGVVVERLIEVPVEVEKQVTVEAPSEAGASIETVPYRSHSAGSQAPAPTALPAAQAQAAGALGPAPTAAPHTAMGRAGPPGPAATPGATGQQSMGPLATAVPPTAARGSGTGQAQPGAVTFQDNTRIPAVATVKDAVSTFSLDTDRTSYRLALNWAREGYEVDPDSVRAEEWVNAFNYGYGYPVSDTEFAITTDVFRHPLEGHKHLARVAFQAPRVQDDSTPLNITIVLDASGSMAEGNRVEIARAAAESLRQSLRPQDRLAVVHFSERVLDSYTVEHTRPDDRKLDSSIRGLRPGGATNVQAGLNLGVQLADEARWQRPEAFNYVILMSDGVANVDATNPFAILETARDYSSVNPIRLITIGVGIENYNDYLLEQLAQHGNGWYRYLDDTQQARTVFSRDNWLSLAIPFADQTRAQVTWDPEMVWSWRIVGYENRITSDESFTQNRKEFAEIPSGAATTVFYELELTNRVAQRPATTAKLGDVELRWVEPTTGRSREQYGIVSGRWREDFDSLGDPLLKLGALVALSADRYSNRDSSLPGPAYVDSPAVNWELARLQQRVEMLSGQLGHLTSYSDFFLLLDHLTRYIPPEAARPPDTGYSP